MSEIKTANTVNAALASFYTFGRKYGPEMAQIAVTVVNRGVKSGSYDLDDLVTDLNKMVPDVMSIKHVRDVHLANSENIKLQTGVEIPTDNMGVVTGCSGADLFARLAGEVVQGYKLAKTIIGKLAK